VAEIAAWLECSPATVDRHADKLVKAGILAIRTVSPSEKGGRPKKVFDVKGGHDADDEDGVLLKFPA
jgi:predicted ArsR family transcriptional regulator